MKILLPTEVTSAMIGALQRLRSEQGLPVHMPDTLNAFGINGGLKHGLAGLLLERRGVKGAGVPDLNQDVDDLLLLFVGDHVGQIVVFDLVVHDRDDLVLGDV